LGIKMGGGLAASTEEINDAIHVARCSDTARISANATGVKVVAASRAALSDTVDHCHIASPATAAAAADLGQALCGLNFAVRVVEHSLETFTIGGLHLASTSIARCRPVCDDALGDTYWHASL
jgi:hypothetical protein